MLYNSKALTNKVKYLDGIRDNLEVLLDVVHSEIGDDVKIHPVTRVFSPGGGSTCFIVENKEDKYFLKVKHESVIVESRLEEMAYIWQSLYDETKTLFDLGIVHTDINEKNIRCDEDSYQITFIDMEEAEFIEQHCNFEESLDFIGYNAVSTLGEYTLSSVEDYTVSYNCLLRLKEVFKKYILEKMPEFLKQCNYDSSNGIVNVIDHGKSELTYQSIDDGYIKIQGQRELHDVRLDLINNIFPFFLDEAYNFVDVGSNNGSFVRTVSALKNIKRSIGLEGFHTFNVLADTLAFLEDKRNCEFHDFLCGENDLAELFLEGPSIFSICSVWHHIVNKDVVLEQLKNIDVRFIFLEMPTQPECYPSGSWETETAVIQHTLGFKDLVLLGFSPDYARPLILLCKDKFENVIKEKINSIANEILVEHK